MPHDHQRQHKLEEHLATSAAKLVEAELKVLETENDGQVNLAEERWLAHKEAHVQLAQQLDHSQAQANEWRGTVADLRSTFLTLAEWRAEHKSLITRVEALEDARLSAVAEARTVRDVFNQGRNLILLAVALIGVAITVIVYVRG